VNDIIPDFAPLYEAETHPRKETTLTFKSGSTLTFSIDENEDTYGFWVLYSEGSPMYELQLNLPFDDVVPEDAN
jgi:hypothetical protein